MAGNQKIYKRPDGEPMSGDERRRARAVYLRRKRRRRQILLYSILLVAFASVGIALSLTVFFHIDNVQIENSAIYSQEEIIAAANIEPGKNLFLFDADAASESVESSLPYIGKLTIKRRLPGTLVLNVEETSERAAIAFNGMYVLINGEGKVLSNASAELGDETSLITDVNIVEATPGKQAVLAEDGALESIKKIVAALDACSLDKITEMRVCNSSSLYLMYDNRLSLKLGSSAELERKLQLAKECITTENQRNPEQRGEINLTIDGRAYVGPEKGTTAIPEITDIAGAAQSAPEMTAAAPAA